MGIRIITGDNPLSDPAVAAVVDRLCAGVLTAGPGRPDVRKVVADIIAAVRAEGDAAIIALAQKLDNCKLTPQTIRVQHEQIQSAYDAQQGDFLKIIRRAIANIRDYQESILVKSPPPLKRTGRELAVRYTPVDRVGVYVPGGKALYPSTVLMTVVPAQVAGVKAIALASPPTTDGDIHPMVLALAGELGVDEVYRLGGAQAIAAMACGTQSVGKVDMIVGPGNAYVAEAKRQLFGLVGVDSIAGPSEVLIIADETAEAAWLAADMLAQAEHDPGSAILVATSQELAQDVASEIEKQLEQLDRKDAAARAIDENSLIIVAGDLEQACSLANEFAAEHLQIVTADDEAVLGRIRHAGAIFLGPHTPVPLGDYYAGPSHVLPTGTTARFFSALSCNDFLKASSVVRYDAGAMNADADDVIDFATREGLTAHARAVEIRKERD